MGWVFDEDTDLVPTGAGTWTVDVSDRWNIGPTPNGGFLMTLLIRAAAEMSPQPDPLSVTAHYLGRTDPGPVSIRAALVKPGRNFSTVEASLFQGDRERVRMLGTFGDLGRQRGPTRIVASRPELGPDEGLVRNETDSSVVKIADRFDLLLPPEQAAGVLGTPTGNARVTGKVRFSDGRPPDLVSLALFADAFPPTVFQLGHYTWIPTIELTVHFRAKPAPGWLWCDFRTRFLIDGLMEEDGEIWDETGRPVALSRQLARVPA